MFQLKRHTLVAGARFGFEVLGLVASWYATFYLRLFLNPLFTRIDHNQLVALVPPVSYVLALWIPARLWLSVSRPQRAVASGEAILRLLESVVVASGLMIVATFLFRQFGADRSRTFVLLFMPVSLTVMLLTQYLGALILSAFESHLGSPERVAIIGEGEEASRLANRVMHAGDSAMLAGIILPEHPASGALVKNAPILGTTATLSEVINRTHLDRIIIVHGCVTDREVDAYGVISRRMGVVLHRSVSVPDAGVRVDFSRRFGVPAIELSPAAFTRRQEMAKRCLDIVVSALVLILISPLMLLFALLIKLTSPGPVFYSAPRVGRGGRYFSFLKFRSMYVNKIPREKLASKNEKGGKLFKIKNDPRVTPLGRFMRAYSIDEFPQLVNILRGEMSLVGPRPLPAEDLDPDGQSREFGAWSEQRSQVLPGITGLWQIRGRSNLTFEEMVEFDIEYIRNWSLDLDLKILLVTPLVVLSGKGAY